MHLGKPSGVRLVLALGCCLLVIALVVDMAIEGLSRLGVLLIVSLLLTLLSTCIRPPSRDLPDSGSWEGAGPR
jgi:hypothetical protein